MNAKQPTIPTPPAASPPPAGSAAAARRNLRIAREILATARPASHLGKNQPRLFQLPEKDLAQVVGWLISLHYTDAKELIQATFGIQVTRTALSKFFTRHVGPRLFHPVTPSDVVYEDDRIVITICRKGGTH